MGIRVNKVLGYGIEDLDVRFMDDEYAADSKYNKTVKDFGAWWKEKYPDALKFENDMFMAYQVSIQGTKLHTHTCLNYYDHEKGHGPVVFTPFGSNWHRRDDDIDYAEARGDGHDTLDWLTTPIYPYSDYVRFGKEYTNGYERYNDIIMDEYKNGKPDKPHVPYTPYSIKLYLEYMGFENPYELWKSLRPVVYTYWC